MKVFSSALFLFVGVSLLVSCQSSIINMGSGVRGNGDIVTLEREIGKDIRTIDTYGSFDLTVADAVPDGIIRLTGESNLLEFIETASVGQHLNISLKKGSSISSNHGIELQMNARTLKSVNLRGSGDVFLENISSVEGLSLAVYGSGDIKANVNSENLSARVTGSGDIELSGETANFHISINGSGDVSALDLTATRATAEINGSGDAKLFVTEALNVEIAGSGTVRYKGPAEKIHSNIRGSGSVKRIQ